MCCIPGEAQTPRGHPWVSAILPSSSAPPLARYFFLLQLMAVHTDLGTWVGQLDPILLKSMKISWVKKARFFRLEAGKWNSLIQVKLGGLKYWEKCSEGAATVRVKCCFTVHPQKYRIIIGAPATPFGPLWNSYWPAMRSPPAFLWMQEES